MGDGEGEVEGSGDAVGEGLVEGSGDGVPCCLGMAEFSESFWGEYGPSLTILLLVGL